MIQLLVIQTAFTGDVVLATALLEKLHEAHPGSVIDMLVRKGNEGLLQNHPFLRRVIVWDKKQHKIRNLLRIARDVRKARYTHVVNVHRFATSGLFTWLSGAKNKVGFDKNPFSFCYTRKVTHIISEPYTSNPVHETQRNQELIADIAPGTPAMPCLYPSQRDRDAVTVYQARPYVCIAPSSVWFTKQFPVEKWAGMMAALPDDCQVYLLGGPGDEGTAAAILNLTPKLMAQSLCGKLTYLQSAALMQGAVMNYANDSAPLHFASAMNAPVMAVFCSTVPAFGFGPLRENGKVVEIQERLSCRPCGLHGRRECPQGHFKCAREITNEQLVAWTSKAI